MITLPDKARRKLGLLQTELETTQANVSSTLTQISLANQTIGYSNEGTTVADQEFNLSRLRAKLGKEQTKFQQLSGLLANLRRFLTENVKRSDVLVDAKPVKLKERSGESTFDAIDRIRMEISSHSSELKDVRDAGLPLDEVRAQAVKWIHQQGLRCTPKITATQKKFDITFGEQQSFTNPAPDLPAFLCWLDPEAMLDLLSKEIGNRPVPKLVLTPADRDRRMSELKELLLRLERSEEQLISQAEAEHDQFMERRPNADPMAVLGLAIEKRAIEPKAAVA
jgi:hypothetical protein